MLTLRKAEQLDLASLYCIAEEHMAKFLDDYHEITPRDCAGIINDPNTLIISDNGYPAGAIWFDEYADDLHSTIHFILNPAYWKAFRKEKVAEQVIEKAFEQQDIARIYAFTMDTQKTANKLLKELGFFSHIPWRSHTKQGGKRRDVTFHELKRSKWSKRLTEQSVQSPALTVSQVE